MVKRSPLHKATQTKCLTMVKRQQQLIDKEKESKEMTNNNKSNNNIVKTIAKNVVSCLIIMVIVATVLGTINYVEHHYTVEMTVVSVEDEVVKLKDKRDEIWEFCGDGYEKGQVVRVKMYDNTTNTIFDDVIEDVTIK